MSPPVNIEQQTGSIFKAAELLELLNERKFKLKWLELGTHTVSNWQNESLFDFPKDDKKDWRLFSITDFIWLHTIAAFRSIGTPFPLIKSLKEHLFENISLEFIIDSLRSNPELIDKIASKEEREMIRKYIESGDVTLDNTFFSYLTLIVVESLAKRVPVTLFVFEDDSFYPLFGYSNVIEKELMNKMMYQHFVSVSLTQIIEKFILKDETGYYMEQFGMLNEKELELLKLLKSGDYISVTVKLKNKEMKMIEAVKEFGTIKEVLSVLASSSYQEIQIKQHGGQITRIENTHKIMF